MQGEQGDGFNLDDRDRLPWLEPAEEIESYERVSVQKVAALVLIGLALIGLIVGGGWWLMSRGDRAGADVALIPAPPGDYKIPAPDPQAREFAGEGDSAYSASEGGEATGRIDPSKAPEAPMAFFDGEELGAGEDGEALPPPPATAAKAPAVPARPTPAATPMPRAPAKAVAGTTASAPIKNQPRTSAAITTSKPSTGNGAPSAPAAVAGGARIQLGAYNSEGIAKEAWSRLVKRFEELGTANYSVEPVTSGGKTLYRLRMGTGSTSEANAVCGRLRVAGESCWVVR